MLACIEFIDHYVPPTSDSAWSILFTFCTILMATLSLWAQLTVRTSQDHDLVKRKWATISLSWIYAAIVFDIVALGLLFYTYYGQLLSEYFRFLLYRIGLGLVLTSFLLAFIHMCESLISLLLKIYRNLNLFDSLLGEISHDTYKSVLSYLYLAAFLVLLFSVGGAVFGAVDVRFFCLWAGNVIPVIVMSCKYRSLLGVIYDKLDISISSHKYRSMWKEVWSCLPRPVQHELVGFIRQVVDRSSCIGKRNVYGSYSDGDHVISLYIQDLDALSTNAIHGVLAHELGHAYCHLVCGTASLLGISADKMADYTASAWGFKSELDALSEERKPEQDVDE